LPGACRSLRFGPRRRLVNLCHFNSRLSTWRKQAANKHGQRVNQRIPSPRDALQHIQYDADYLLASRVMRYPPDLQSAFDKHAAHLEKCFEALAKLRDRAHGAGFTELENLVNVAQFALILQYDLRIHGSDCEATRQNWRRNLYARQIATTIFESIEDLNSLCGKALKEYLPKLAPRETLVSLRSTLKGLSSFRKQHSLKLKEIRNIASAHREHDASKQISTMEAMDMETILNLNAEYILWLNELLEMIDETAVHSYRELQKRSKGG
jgi:hypothetical protein